MDRFKSLTWLFLGHRVEPQGDRSASNFIWLHMVELLLHFIGKYWHYLALFGIFGECRFVGSSRNICMWQPYSPLQGPLLCFLRIDCYNNPISTQFYRPSNLVFTNWSTCFTKKRAAWLGAFSWCLAETEATKCRKCPGPAPMPSLQLREEG